MVPGLAYKDAMPQSQLPPDVLEALRKGNKIEAIKLLREKMKVGLAEAKNVVDSLERHAGHHEMHGDQPHDHADHHPRIPHSTTPASPPIVVHPGLSPGEQPRRAGGMGFLILIAVAVVGWVYWKFG